MKQCYREMNFRASTLRLIEQLNSIIDEYIAGGYILTIRQLYYQLVARDILPNSIKSYKYVTRVAADGRIAGLIDWDAIEDRMREFVTRTRWNSPQQILQAAVSNYHTDPWATQKVRPYLIVEKDALVGIFEKVCSQYDVPLMAARGYLSVSAVREFVEQQVLPSDQEVIVFHFGDHDPSGIDMTRDIDDRCELFAGGQAITLMRMALNHDQVKQYKPPPNPAKATDSRFLAYKKRFGTSSWELDALNPKVLTDLAEQGFTKVIEPKAWAKWAKGQARVKAAMQDHISTFKG